MTHAEFQDLLLDLACGELDAARAAEVESHLAVCPECRAEKEALDQARRMTAPLREAEEPPGGFDDRILEAARAQAQLDHEGNVGQVIEVSGNVRPLGVEAARIDAHAPVKARPVERRRPRWMVRIALGGSVAAAAALALVVSTTLETRRAAEKASQAKSEDYSIRVQPAAPEAVGSALRDGEANRDAARVPALEDRKVAPAAGPRMDKEDKLAQVVVPARKPAAESGAPAGGLAGAGKPLPPASAAPPAAAASRAIEPAAPQAAREVAPAPRAAEKQSAPAAAQDIGRAEAPAAKAKRAAAPVADAQTMEADAPAMEANAQSARHSGSYALAASLYRSAAGLRGRADERDAAAWDLAHAVECLAAIGQFDEARKVREELSRLYPAERTALSAAQRALREVEVPGAKQQ